MDPSQPASEKWKNSGSTNPTPQKIFEVCVARHGPSGQDDKMIHLLQEENESNPMSYEFALIEPFYVEICYQT